jgi:hypothetical protein
MAIARGAMNCYPCLERTLKGLARRTGRSFFMLSCATQRIRRQLFQIRSVRNAQCRPATLSHTVLPVLVRNARGARGHLNVRREKAHVVERWSKWDCATRRDAFERRLQSDHAAECPVARSSRWSGCPMHTRTGPPRPRQPTRYSSRRVYGRCCEDCASAQALSASTPCKRLGGSRLPARVGNPST